MRLKYLRVSGKIMLVRLLSKFLASKSWVEAARDGFLAVWLGQNTWPLCFLFIICEVRHYHCLRHGAGCRTACANWEWSEELSLASFPCFYWCYLKHLGCLVLLCIQDLIPHWLELRLWSFQIPGFFHLSFCQIVNTQSLETNFWNLNLDLYPKFY